MQVRLLPDALQNVSGPFVYRSRTPPSHGGKRGSIPLRTTDTAEWWNEQTRRPQKAVLFGAWECNSPLGHSLAGLAGAWPTLIRSAARLDTGACNSLLRVGAGPAGGHDPGGQVRLLDPRLTAEYANRQSEQVENL